MFNGKQLDLLQNDMFDVKSKVERLLQLAIVNKDKQEPTGDYDPDNTKIMELLSKNAKLITENNMLTTKLKQVDAIIEDLQKRARPKRKNRKPITKKASFKQVSEEEKAQFLEMYDRGLSTLEMSVQTNRSASCISNWIKKLRPEDFTDED